MAERFAVGFETRGLDALAASPEVNAGPHDPRGLALAARGILEQSDASIMASLGEISVPTLVLVGQDDQPFLAAAEIMAAKIPGAAAGVHRRGRTRPQPRPSGPVRRRGRGVPGSPRSRLTGRGGRGSLGIRYPIGYHEVMNAAAELHRARTRARLVGPRAGPPGRHLARHAVGLRGRSEGAVGRDVRPGRCRAARLAATVELTPVVGGPDPADAWPRAGRGARPGRPLPRPPQPPSFASPSSAPHDVTIPQKIVAIHQALDAGGIPHAFGGALALAWCTQRARGTIDIDLNVFVGADRADRRARGAARRGGLDRRRRHGARRRDGQATALVGRRRRSTCSSTRPTFHDQAATGPGWEPFEGVELPFLSCPDLAVFKAFFDRTKDWADLEEMARRRHARRRPRRRGARALPRRRRPPHRPAVGVGLIAGAGCRGQVRPLSSSPHPSAASLCPWPTSEDANHTDLTEGRTRRASTTRHDRRRWWISFSRCSSRTRDGVGAVVAADERPRRAGPRHQLAVATAHGMLGGRLRVVDSRDPKRAVGHLDLLHGDGHRGRARSPRPLLRLPAHGSRRVPGGTRPRRDAGGGADPGGPVARRRTTRWSAGRRS